MSYYITEFRVLDNKKVEICLDESERFQLYKAEARNLSLIEGAEVSEEQYHYIIYDILGKRATKRAMHLLERQERTEYQLREKLKVNGYPPEAIDMAIEYVKSYHYVDDDRYAKTYVHYQQDRKSKMRLRMDLMRRGLSGDIIEDTLENTYEVDEKDLIRQLMEKKNFSADIADEAQVRKMYQFLLRKGFQSSDIMSVMKYSDT